MVRTESSSSVPQTYKVCGPRKRWKNIPSPSIHLRHQRLREKLRNLLKELEPEARRDVIPLLRKGGHKTPISERIPWFPLNCTPRQEQDEEEAEEDTDEEVDSADSETNISSDSKSTSSLPTLPLTPNLDQKLEQLNWLKAQRSIQLAKLFEPFHLNLLQTQRQNPQPCHQDQSPPEETNQQEKDQQIKILQLIIQRLIKSKTHDSQYTIDQLKKRLAGLIDGNPPSSETKSILAASSPHKVVQLSRLRAQSETSHQDHDQDQRNLRMDNISKLITQLKKIESSVKFAKKSWMYMPDNGNLSEECKIHEQKYRPRASGEDIDEALTNDEETIDKTTLAQLSPAQTKSTLDEKGENYNEFNHSRLNSPDVPSAEQSMDSSPPPSDPEELLESSSQSDSSSSSGRRIMLTLKPNVKLQQGSVFTSGKTDNAYTFLPSCRTVSETTIRLLTATYAMKAQCDNLTLTEKKSVQVEKDVTLKPSVRSKRKSTDKSSCFYSGGFNKFSLAKRPEKTLPNKVHPDFQLDLENGTVDSNELPSSLNHEPSPHPSTKCRGPSRKTLTKEEILQAQLQRMDLAFLTREHVTSTKLRQLADRLVCPSTESASIPSLASLARLSRENQDIKTLNWAKFFNATDCEHCCNLKSSKNTSNGNSASSMDISDSTDGVVQIKEENTDDSLSDHVNETSSEFNLQDQFSHTICGYGPGQNSLPFLPNPVVDHTIDLQHYKLELEQRLEQLINDRAAVKIPEHPKKKRLKKQRTHLRNLKPLSTIPMDDENIKTYTNAALCNMLAQIGYTHIQSPALELLAEVLERQLKNICSKLNEAQEKVSYGVPDGFLDPMDRVLNDLGINGIEGIVEFYKTRVLNYHDSLEMDIQNLESKIASGFYHHYKTMNEKSKQKPSLKRGPTSPAYSK